LGSKRLAGFEVTRDFLAHEIFLRGTGCGAGSIWGGDDEAVIVAA
jgi:hypothetical protein